MSSELWQRPATELGTMIRGGDVLPSEILESVIARIEEHEPKVHAFITRTDEVAREDAERADQRARSGSLIGPMDGIPFSIKDLDDTAGIRTTKGSKFLEHNVPEHDSATAERLRKSGGLLLGKTNTPHFGYKDMCDNFVAETTVNPWKLDRTAGGSSGGAAAAVASGFGPFGQGGDGAGSIRIPAALCGVVGFKPSFGRVSMYPYREYWTHRTHNGPLARNVSDAAMMLKVLAGPDLRDPATITTPLEPYEPLAQSDQPLAGMKVRWSADLGYGPVETEIADIVQNAVDVLAELGCAIDNAPPGWDDTSEFHRVIYTTQIANGIGSVVESNPDWVEDTLQAMIDAGKQYSAVELRRAEAKRGELYASSMKMFDAVDFFVSPTMPLEAWSAFPDRESSIIDCRDYFRGQEKFALFGRTYALNPFNLTGQPAISLPCGWTKSGLPVGIQIAGALHRDIAVLQIAEALERRLALTDQWPAFK